MLLMIEKATRGGICQAIHRCAKANNKYMKNYNKDVISSYLMYLDASNLYEWAMSQKLTVTGFKWVDKLFDFYKDLPFSPERKKVNKVDKLICSIEEKEKYVMHIRVLKKALNHGLVLRKVHRVIQFNQEDWLKPYIDMNTKLRRSKN